MHDIGVHYVTEGIIASFKCTHALKHVMLAKCDLNILLLMMWPSNQSDCRTPPQNLPNWFSKVVKPVFDSNQSAALASGGEDGYCQVFC